MQVERQVVVPAALVEDALVLQVGDIAPGAGTNVGAPLVSNGRRIRRKNRDDRNLGAVQAALLTAPDVPATLELKQGERLLLRAAAHFADVREADFTAAASRQDLEGVQATLVERHSRADGTWRLWLLLLLGVLGASWWVIHRPALRRTKLAAV